MSWKGARASPSPRPEIRAHGSRAGALGKASLLWAVFAAFSAGCRGEARSEAKPLAAPGTSAGRAPAALNAPSAAAAGSAKVEASRPAAAAEGVCPTDMLPIPGAAFWVGSTKGTGSDEEAPRFRTRVAPFCMDATEVTTAAYAQCVERQACTAAATAARACNYGRADRAQHPINCVTWKQASDHCRSRGARLPTEVEWEYAARGGEEYRTYSWGAEKPDGRTCWKRGSSCPVASFAAGAFGLFDMTGNVWEWTSTAFASYPWPPVGDGQRVYRGGSWSRRFEKWMRPRLRNRSPQSASGSHLGFRCAATQKNAHCPYGRGEDGLCLHGVDDAECEAGSSWNGQRCAKRGASECAEGARKVPGHGCVLSLDGDANFEAPRATPVVRTPTPEHDADCAAHQPGRPRAFRFSGGTHAGRNHAGAKLGCKNRDVGIGWNSSCCPG